MAQTSFPVPHQGPALVRSAPSRRGRDPRTVRRRYKAVQWVLASIGGTIGAIEAYAALGALTSKGLLPGAPFYALLALLVVIGLGLPWLLVGALWRWKCRRKDWDPR